MDRPLPAGHAICESGHETRLACTTTQALAGMNNSMVTKREQCPSSDEARGAAWFVHGLAVRNFDERQPTLGVLLRTCVRCVTRSVRQSAACRVRSPPSGPFALLWVCCLRWPEKVQAWILSDRCVQSFLLSMCASDMLADFEIFVSSCKFENAFTHSRADTCLTEPLPFHSTAVTVGSASSSAGSYLRSADFL